MSDHWFVVISDTVRSMFARPCLHTAAWIDPETGNVHSKTVGHYPKQTCTVPPSELPIETEE